MHILIICMLSGTTPIIHLLIPERECSEVCVIRPTSTIIVAIEDDYNQCYRTGDLNASGNDGVGDYRSEEIGLRQLCSRGTAFIYTEIQVRDLLSIVSQMINIE